MSNVLKSIALRALLVVATLVSPAAAWMQTWCECDQTEHGHAPPARFDGSGGPLDLEADFLIVPTAYEHLRVEFRDLSRGPVKSRLWEFGDGTRSRQRNPVHVYGESGTYRVRLTVTGQKLGEERTLTRTLRAGQACPASSARENGSFPFKLGADFIPVVPNDSAGFYVIYSARQSPSLDGSVGNTAAIFLFELENNEILLFGGGYGDPLSGPNSALFDAATDAATIDDTIKSCLGRSPAQASIRFVAPHGHGDHVNGPLFRELRTLGYQVVDIAYQELDESLLNGINGWTDEDRAVFRTIPTARICNESLEQFDSPLGRIWVLARPGHTPGCLDVCLDVGNDPNNRFIVRGSAEGGNCPMEPAGTTMAVGAHGNALMMPIVSDLVDPPVLTTISPIKGSSGGLTPVTLTGVGFVTEGAGDATVMFGSRAATSVEIMNDGSLSCLTPSGTTGQTVNVTLLNANGQSQLLAAYKFNNPTILSDVAPGQGSSLGGTQLVIDGSGFAEPGAGTTSILLGGRAATDVVVEDDGRIICTTPSGNPGATVDLALLNAHGQVLMPAAFTYELEPSLTLVVPMVGPGTGETAVTLTGTGFTGAGANSVSFGGIDASSVSVIDDTTLTCMTPAGTPGTSVQVSLANGNGGDEISSGFTYNPAPAVLVVAPGAGTSLGATTVTLTGTGFTALDAGTPTITFGGLQATDVNVLSDSKLTCSAPAGIPGQQVDVQISNVNGSGNFPGAYRYYPAPALTAVTPSVGATGGGTSVDLSGSGLLQNQAGPAAVFFGAQPATNVVVNDDTSLTCTAPAGLANSLIDITISNANGFGILPGAFLYQAPPSLLAVSPALGVPAGTTSITIQGSGFRSIGAGTTSVSFGSQPAQNVTVVDDTTLTCKTPPGTPDAQVLVGVTNDLGSSTLPGAFRYLPGPVNVLALTPASGAAEGGDLVTLLGTGFQIDAPGTNRVFFDSVEASSVQVLDDGRLTCMTPPGQPLAAVQVLITNDNGVGTLEGGYSFLAPRPRVTAIRPKSGSSQGTTRVTLEGTGFADYEAGPAFVAFDGLPATEIEVSSDTLLKCVVPAGEPGQIRDLVLSNQNGAAELLAAFEYNPVPTLTRVSPEAGTSLGGSLVGLFGSGFLAFAAGDNSVTFDGVPATDIFVLNDSELLCSVPAGRAGAKVNVEISNRNGAGSMRRGFRYYPAPEVLGTAPARSSSMGGVLTTVTGSGFLVDGAGDNAVFFDGVPASAVVVLDDTTLTCLTPPGPEGAAVVVSVSNGNGTGTGSVFDYAPRPFIDYVDPPGSEAAGRIPVTIHGSGFQNDGAGVNEVLFGTKAARSIVVLDDNTISCTVPPGVAETNVNVTITNVNGTRVLTSGFRYYGPVRILSLEPAAGSSLGGAPLQLVGQGFNGNNTLVTVGGTPATGLQVQSDLLLTCTVPSGTPGASVDVTVTNDLGTDTFGSAFAYHPLPVIDAISVDHGSAVGGTSVSLTGSGFLDGEAGQNMVLFGSQPATGVTLVDDGTLTCISPPGNWAETVDVTVINANGQNALVQAFRYHDRPTISSVAPAAGTSLGGFEVTVTGTGFQTDDAGSNLVRFDGVAAADVQVTSDTTLTCSAPAGSGGAMVDISVQNQNGTFVKSNTFSYYPTPIVTSISPDRGTSLGGTDVTLSGSGFTANDAGTVSVLFGSTPAAQLDIQHDGTLVATAPTGLAGTSVDIVVSNDNGLFTLASAFLFNKTPVIFGLVPAQGPPAGGTTIVLNGQGFLMGFAGANEVRIGGVVATDVVRSSDSVLSCTLPAGVPGASVDVEVENANGYGILSAGFKYNNEPAIAGVSPPDGPASGGEIVTLTGEGFDDGIDDPEVRVDGDLVSGLIVEDDGRLTFSVPGGDPDSSASISLSNANGSTLFPSAFRYRALPSLSAIEPTNASPEGGSDVTVLGSGFLEPPGDLELRIGSLLLTDLIVVDDSTLTATVPAGPPDSVFDVVLTSTNGTATLLGAWRYNSIPTLASIAPNLGGAGGGTELTLTGTGFENDGAGQPSITIGGEAATDVEVVDDTTVLCTTPAGPVGPPVGVTLTNANGSTSLSGSFRYRPGLALTAVTPPLGSPDGGSTVTLTGEGFTAGNAGMNFVYFASVPASDVTVLDDTLLTCTAPQGTPGEVSSVSVVNNNGQALLDDAFEFAAGPVVLAVTPNSGVASGRTRIELTGFGFEGADPTSSVVMFGSLDARNIQMIEDGSLFCDTPPGTEGTVVDVVVITDEGNYTVPQGFTYVAGIPALESVTPPEGSAWEWTRVTLTGQGFSSYDPAALGITFDGRPARNVRILDDQTLACLAPPGPSGRAALVSIDDGNEHPREQAGLFTWKSRLEPDLNGDGFGDRIWPHSFGAELALGQASGLASGALQTLLVSTPESPDLQADVGDFNADSRPDLVLAPVGPGREVWIFFGPFNGRLPLVPVPDLRLEEPLPGTGTAIAVGDVNGDGISDLAIARQAVAPEYGRVTTFLGGPVFGAHRLSLESRHHEDLFATTLFLGDLDGDGLAEWIVGAPGDDESGIDSGAVHIFPGSEHPVSASAWDVGTRWVGTQAGDRFGSSLLLSPWRDPLARDLFIGAPGWSTTAPEAGCVYVFGATRMSLDGLAWQADVLIQGDTPGLRFGSTLRDDCPGVGLRHQLWVGAPTGDSGLKLYLFPSGGTDKGDLEAGSAERTLSDR